MGRKKKKNVIKTNTDNTVSGTQTIGYQGTITCSIARGNKIINTRKFHNAGMPNLFRFLANCLAGNLNSQLRPVQIKLFRYPGADALENSPSNFCWSKVWVDAAEKAPFSISPYINYNATPVIQREVADPNNPDNDYYKVTFHFRIPYTFLADNTVHIIGFYPNNVSSEQDEVFAYYLFTQELEDKSIIWAPLEISGDINNFSILIDWTLSVSNKISE